MPHGHEQEERWRLCGAVSTIRDKLDKTFRRAAKSSTVSLSQTVESRQGLPKIAGVAKPVKAVDIEINKEGRDARVKKTPEEPSELESELHSATHIPFRAWYFACVASRAKEDLHWRKRGLRLCRRQGTTSYRLTSGSSVTIQLDRRLRHTASLARCLQFSRAKRSVTA